jgi:nucleoside-specific outer membrane channel protein Tsx
MKVLVVEDDRKVAGFIEQGLKEEGWTVDVAPDGEEATMLAHVYQYDVILLDVVLPKKNGFQVAAELRREGRNTPILMLTSRDAVEDVVRGLDAGADDYLAKPFRSGVRRALQSILRSISWTLASVSLVLPTFASAQETPDSGSTAAPGFFFFSDNSLSLLPYGYGFAVDPVGQSTFTFEHAHASQIGDLFMFVDFSMFYGADGDDMTWYGEFSPRLSLGKIFKKDLSHSFFKRSLFEIKDVLLAAQYERGEDPDAAEAVLVGLGLDLDVREAGLLGRLGKFNYMQLNLYGRAELTEGTDSGIRDMQISLVTSHPFKIGNSQFLVDGYFDWVLGLGDEDWSYHLNPQVTMDVGAQWENPGKLYVGTELDFWWNKYQIPDSPELDTNQAAISLLLKYHL